MHCRENCQARNNSFLNSVVISCSFNLTLCLVSYQVFNVRTPENRVKTEHSSRPPEPPPRSSTYSRAGQPMRPSYAEPVSRPDVNEPTRPVGYSAQSRPSYAKPDHVRPGPTASDPVRPPVPIQAGQPAPDNPFRLGFPQNGAYKEESRGWNSTSNLQTEDPTSISRYFKKFV